MENRILKFRVWSTLNERFETECQDLMIDKDGIIKEFVNTGYEPFFRELDSAVFIVDWFTGLKDKNSVEVFDEDILSDGMRSFRVYSVDGGFVMKASIWKSDKEDLILSDQLILEPLSNIQTKQYIKESCQVVGNIHQHPHLLKSDQ